MSHGEPLKATILVVTDSTSDAEVVKQQLQSIGCNVVVSTNPDRAAQDFEQHRPEVLVLAFNTLEKAERYYLGLYRQCPAIHQIPHRTIILCTKEEVTRACDLCMKDYFDDYILFWPMTYDTSRLPMSVHYALRELAALKSGAPSAAEFAGQVRHLSELENTLGRQVKQGEQRIDDANQAMAYAERQIGAALEGFSQRLIRGEMPDAVHVMDAEVLKQEINSLKQAELQQIRAVAESVQPLKQWTEDFRQECAPHLESARNLNAMAARIRPTILAVDDDQMVRKIIAKLLEAENYELVFATNGIEALTMLRKMRPDLILMDFVMPDMDGQETTRRLKAMPHLAAVPVIMVTSKSEGNVVVECIKAGASGFVVKPFNQATLIAKITHSLHTKAVSPSV